MSFDFTEPADGPAYLMSDICRRLASAVLVYGTLRDAGANRYAAEQLQTRYLRLATRATSPIYKDFEVSDDLLQHRDVIFVGRPETNSALAAWARRLGLDYRARVSSIDGEAHASEREALLMAATNPLDAVAHGAGARGQRRAAHGEGVGSGGPGRRICHLRNRQDRASAISQ